MAMTPINASLIVGHTYSCSDLDKNDKEYNALPIDSECIWLMDKEEFINYLAERQ